MKNETTEYDWEVLPWGLDDKDESYAIWVERSGDQPYLAISNQSDCCEMIRLGSIADFDGFIERLKAARKWLTHPR